MDGPLLLPPTRLCSAADLQQSTNISALAMRWARIPTGGFVSHGRRVATALLSLAALRVRGDFVEAGTYTGGSSVLMAWALQTEPRSVWRNLWAADSFKGLPKASSVDVFASKHDAPPTVNNVAGPGGGNTSWQAVSHIAGKRVAYGRLAASRELFEANLRHHASEFVNAGRLRVVEGWFRDTLKTLPVEHIAFLRLDGDLHESTQQSLEAFYPKLVDGGFIYIDDLGSFAGAARAVREFRAKHHIWEPMIPIAEPLKGERRFEAVWWQKQAGCKGNQHLNPGCCTD